MWESEYKRADETTSIYLAGIETNVSTKTSRLRENNMGNKSENRRMAKQKRTSDQRRRRKCTLNKFCSLRHFNFNKATLIQRQMQGTLFFFCLKPRAFSWDFHWIKDEHPPQMHELVLQLDQTISDGSHIYSWLAIVRCRCWSFHRLIRPILSEYV